MMNFINLYKNITIVTIISINIVKRLKHKIKANMEDIEDIVTCNKIHLSQPEGNKEKGPKQVG